MNASCLFLLRIIDAGSVLIATIAYLVGMALANPNDDIASNVLSVVLIGTLPCYIILVLVYLIVVLPIFSILGGSSDIRARTWLLGVWFLWGVIAGVLAGNFVVLFVMVGLGLALGYLSLWVSSKILTEQVVAPDR
ncbi:hypothetical protein HW115_18700 [Verrucomicrobiaceae bacterium N1E253]|uniref:Uncharacterized protein n=1 Tax=Oceaniferula marina TaxID=2748318 RepID=A0A851GTM4_9BACT|nr:hypothetical protein [Oceaniferula marina]NWK57654.1 hypothetical protein [Oceaniferula marina]